MILKTVERQQEDAAAFLKRPGAPVPNQHWLIRGFQDARGNVMVAETPRATTSTGDVGNS
jgi:L-lysine 2,3-aminomutase